MHKDRDRDDNESEHNLWEQLERLEEQGNNSRQTLSELKELVLHLVRVLETLLKRSSRTRSIKIAFGGTMTTAGKGIVGQTIVASVVPLEADGTTVTPGAVVSGQVFTQSDTTIATQTVNPDGTASYTLLLAGTDTITVTATVTDADGIAGSFTATNSFTVTVPTGRTASVQINFAPAA